MKGHKGQEAEGGGDEWTPGRTKKQKKTSETAGGISEEMPFLLLLYFFVYPVSTHHHSGPTRLQGLTQIPPSLSVRLKQSRTAHLKHSIKHRLSTACVVMHR